HTRAEHNIHWIRASRTNQTSEGVGFGPFAIPRPMTGTLPRPRRAPSGTPQLANKGDFLVVLIPMAGRLGLSEPGIDGRSPLASLRKLAPMDGLARGHLRPRRSGRAPTRLERYEEASMRTRPRRTRRPSYIVELLEPRLVLDAPGTLTIALDPTLDQFGDQIETVQGYRGESRATFGIFDTGSSVVSFSADDQANFT